MADKTLDADHPLKKPRRKRPKAIRAKWQTCPTCRKRINVNDGTGGTHTCYDVREVQATTDSRRNWQRIEVTQEFQPTDSPTPLDRRRAPLTLRTVTRDLLLRLAYRLIKLAQRIGPLCALAATVPHNG